MTTRRLRFAVGAALLLGTPACEDDDVPIGCNPSCVDGGMDAGRDAGDEVINVYPDTGPEPDTGVDAGEEIINVGDSGPPPEEDAGLEAGVEDAGTEDAGTDAGPTEA
ncbi:MAG: hypothetical protein MUE69_32490 [Myxococcota bacterium]|jgi:hypothetical protein|nr:hypothetical protein [Myxococcota bacterium]